jgi:hypothetical protein
MKGRHLADEEFGPRVAKGDHALEPALHAHRHLGQARHLYRAAGLGAAQLSTSLCSGGNSALLSWMATMSVAAPMLTTNSRRAWMLAPVSLRPALRPMFAQQRRLVRDEGEAGKRGEVTTPSSETVVIQAMGRGTTMPLIKR